MIMLNNEGLLSSLTPVFQLLLLGHSLLLDVLYHSMNRQSSVLTCQLRMYVIEVDVTSDLHKDFATHFDQHGGTTVCNRSTISCAINRQRLGTRHFVVDR
jgi:hypothetical protein